MVDIIEQIRSILHSTYHFQLSETLVPSLKRLYVSTLPLDKKLIISIYILIADIAQYKSDPYPIFSYISKIIESPLEAPKLVEVSERRADFIFYV